jgi:hypothetical protein
MLLLNRYQKITCIVVLVFLAAFAFIFLLVKNPALKYNSYDCIKNVEHNLVLVFDDRNNISSKTLDEITYRALNFVNQNLKTKQLISIFKVKHSSHDSLEPIISICAPSTPSSTVTQLLQKFDQNLKNEFELILKGAINNVIEGASIESEQTQIDQSKSDIAFTQYITDISLSKYLSAKQNQLFIVSDLIEDGPRFSLKNCSNPQAMIQKYRLTRKGAQERPIFNNTQIVLNIIPRLEYAESLPCRDQLWKWFFGDNEGKKAELNFDYLPG